MFFSINWLAELAGGLTIPADELAMLITTRTAEQEGVHPAGGHLRQVRAARVVSVEPIPGSENRKAVIDAGPLGTRTVVCGAANCRPGLVTAYVPPGTDLGGRRIETATIAGVVSEGMLASGAELGLNRSGAGILELDCQPGDLIPGCEPDAVIEIDNKSLTHRPDLWGHLGMAREVAAITGSRLRDPVRPDRLPAGAAPIEVRIEDHGLCPRYSALVFEKVTVGPSPLWLQYRLQTIGLNPINNIVDVTNYIMAELAQPMHAFDQDRLAGHTVHVRLARDGETIRALNQEQYALDGNSLVIADDEKPVAIAGVIGGLDTGVNEATRRIVFESANFHPGHIRKTAARLKCRTDASMRFEKSQDPYNTVRALARAIELLEIVCPGIRLVGGLADNSAPLRTPAPIALPIGWLRRKLGRAVETGEVRRILEALEFGVEETGPAMFSVTPPSWRATRDISIKDDLVEEVGRMLGYGSITPAAPLLPAEPPPENRERDCFHTLRQQTCAQGFTEVHNYSFVNEERAIELGMEPASHLRVANPIASDQTLLRMSLLPGILKNIRDNSRHFVSCRFFEIGFAIHPRRGEIPDQVPWLAACRYERAGDGVEGLFELKRLAECLLPGVGVEPVEPRPHEHPFRAYQLSWKGAPAGRIGEFHPRLVEGRAAVLEVDLRRLIDTAAPPMRYQPLQRFPSSEFDLSVVAGDRELVGAIEQHVIEAAGPWLRGVAFVRQYAGPPLAEGRKSVSFRITIGADDRTLSAEEIAAERQRMIEWLRRAGFELRV
jgi:phenylalanyl-tRNA synthetase beta chain